jgi:hypothetical protein
MLRYFIVVSMILCGCTPSPSPKAITDTPFIQEYHEVYPIDNTPATNDVRAVAIDNNDNVWAATKAGIYVLGKGKKEWIGLSAKEINGPAFDVEVDGKGIIWIANWDGLYMSASEGVKKIIEINVPVSTICVSKNGILCFGPDGMWQQRNSGWEFTKLTCSGEIRSVIGDKSDGLWIASGAGLYHKVGDDIKLYQNTSNLLTPYLSDLAYTQDGRLWIGGFGGITIYENEKRSGQFTPENGLPTVHIQSVERAPNGKMWVGTQLGVTRYNGKTWSLRHSRRWLLSDDVRDIAFDSEATAWIATAKGVSAIKQKKMTLADKAEHFEQIRIARHVREPGIVEKCRLEIPGDLSTWKPRDDDNDGQYTSMYLAMESFRYAVTKSPQSKSNAKKSFEALLFLQTVTETSGFVARTVVPSTWQHMADANRKISDQEWAEMRINNPREKRVEKRWRLSKDGKWLWKGDTSSDEMTGHMYGYLFYHDLVADDTEKKRVSDLVCRIMDYIMEGGYNLLDIDGKHTKWAVWSPEKLNNDPDWRTERGINSLEILSYLKLAYHMSGNEKYQKAYIGLLYDHNYLKNIEEVKTLNPAWRTHIDDELLALAFPCLLLYEEDPELKRAYRKSFDQWYDAVKDDCSPYFNFMYGAFTGSDPNLDGSIESLRDTPLDLVRWRIDNTKREDVQLVRYPEMERIQTNRLLPVSERGGVMRWDRNPWDAIQGDGGYTESDGVFWLLPYWMGRYYGFIL